MNTYKVWIQIEEVDKNSNHCLKLGTPYEASKFNTETEAGRFVENELMVIRPINRKLHTACRQVLDSLDVGGEQSRQFAEEIKILRKAVDIGPIPHDECPKRREE